MNRIFARRSFQYIATSSIVLGAIGGSFIFSRQRNHIGDLQKQLNSSQNRTSTELAALRSKNAELDKKISCTEATKNEVSFASVVQKTVPAVVSIERNYQVDLNHVAKQKHSVTASQGSGVIVRKDGLILTNKHVVQDVSNQDVDIILNDGRELKARVVLTDPAIDLAVLKVIDPPSDLQFVPLGNVGTENIGDVALAIGSPLGLAGMVHNGIISSIIFCHRSTVPHIFTSASITSGSSGGALVNTKGELVALLQGASARDRGKYMEQIGVAIPVNYMHSLVKSADEGQLKRPTDGLLVNIERFLPRYPGVQFGTTINPDKEFVKCPKNHNLVRVAVKQLDFRCDNCSRKKLEITDRCHVCDYDLCASCHFTKVRELNLKSNNHPASLTNEHISPGDFSAEVMHPAAVHQSLLGCILFLDIGDGYYCEVVNERPGEIYPYKIKYLNETRPSEWVECSTKVMRVMNCSANKPLKFRFLSDDEIVPTKEISKLEKIDFKDSSADTSRDQSQSQSQPSQRSMLNELFGIKETKQQNDDDVGFYTRDDVVDAGPSRRSLEELGKVSQGVRINHVISGGPGDQVGIQPGDIITAINGRPVPDPVTYQLILATLEPGDVVQYSLLKSSESSGSESELFETANLQLGSHDGNSIILGEPWVIPHGLGPFCGTKVVSVDGLYVRSVGESPAVSKMNPYFGHVCVMCNQVSTRLSPDTDIYSVNGLDIRGVDDLKRALAIASRQTAFCSVMKTHVQGQAGQNTAIGLQAFPLYQPDNCPRVPVVKMVKGQAKDCV